MEPKITLLMLYDELSNALESTVTHIEPIKTFKRPGSLVTFCRVQISRSLDTYVWIKTQGRKPILDLNFKAPVKFSGDAAHKHVKQHSSDQQTLRKELGVYEKRTIRDYDLTKHLYNTLDLSGPFLVPRPLFHSPEHYLMVTEHMAGEPLQDKIARGARWMSSMSQQKSLEKECYQVGQWLRAFQEATRDYCPGMSHGLELLKVKNSERIVEQTMDRVEQLTQQDSSVFDQRLICLIKNFLVQNLTEAQQSKNSKNDYICSVHGDFFPGNILSNKNSVIGLDFTGSTWGSRYHDLSYFVFQIETLCKNIRYKNSVRHPMITAFVSGYGNINLDDLDKGFWNLNPEIKNNFVSHCISRLLFLYDSSWNSLNPRFVYRKIDFYRTKKQLAQHISK